MTVQRPHVPARFADRRQAGACSPSTWTCTRDGPISSSWRCRAAACHRLRSRPHLHAPLDVFVVRKLGAPGIRSLRWAPSPAAASACSTNPSSRRTGFRRGCSTPSCSVSARKSCAASALPGEPPDSRRQRTGRHPRGRRAGDRLDDARRRPGAAAPGSCPHRGRRTGRVAAGLRCADGGRRSGHLPVDAGAILGGGTVVRGLLRDDGRRSAPAARTADHRPGTTERVMREPTSSASCARTRSPSIRMRPLRRSSR